jgi:hypothetical protein
MNNLAQTADLREVLPDDVNEDQLEYLLDKYGGNAEAAASAYFEHHSVPREPAQQVGWAGCKTCMRSSRRAHALQTRALAVKDDCIPYYIWVFASLLRLRTAFFFNITSIS